MSDNTMYHEGMRQLQEARQTRALADRLEEMTVHDWFTQSDRDFIERASMLFIATADADGRPDCSYKGGLPGFVRVIDDNTLAIPDYDGNGMYRSWGNVLTNSNVGLLFIDFENQSRMRVNGKASINKQDPLLGEFTGAVFIIRVSVTRVFPNCPRYIHKMKLVEYSEYAPKDQCTPPVPEWKTYDEFNDVLPDRDRINGVRLD